MAVSLTLQFTPVHDPVETAQMNSCSPSPAAVGFMGQSAACEDIITTLCVSSEV